MPRRGVDLTEEQWREVKAHAAKRGQTISELFADVLAEIGLDGQMRPQTVNVGRGPLIDVGGPPPIHTFGHSSPAPKPGKKR